MRVGTAIGSLLAAPFGPPRQAAKEPATKSIGVLIVYHSLIMWFLNLQEAYQNLSPIQHQDFGKMWMHDLSVMVILDKTKDF